MGGIFGGGTTTSQSSTSVSPWGPEASQLQSIYGDAATNYANQQQAGPYTGNFVPGQNPIQAGANTAANAWTTGQGSTIPGQLSSSATPMLGAGAGYTNNANLMASTGLSGPNAGLYGTMQGYGTGAMTTPGASAPLSSALNTAGVAGANALTGFSNNLANAATTAQGNPTGQVEANANSYASNPTVQAEVNATNAGINQTLNESTVPGLNRQAAGEGALNSSRAGMGEAMANQSAGIAEGQADASIYGNAYNTGVNTASNLYASGLNSNINASTLGYNDAANAAEGTAAQQTGVNQFNANTALNAANGGLSQGLNYEEGNANTMLGANAQLGGAYNEGLGGATAATNAATANYGLGSAAGNAQYTTDQGGLTNSLDQWGMQNGYASNILNTYDSTITNGAPADSSSTTGSTTQPQNILGGILGTAIGGLGLYQDLGGDTNFFGSSNTGPSTFSGASNGGMYSSSGLNLAGLGN